MSTTKGYFLISLDFELQWGRFDKVNLDDNRKKELDNTLELLPKMLDVFRDNEIAVTWAVVGMLFNKNANEWKRNIPVSTPNYFNKKLSPYNYFNSLESTVNIDKYFFSLDLIQLIAGCQNQELASHTYSHYYCLEQGQISQNFKDDLVKAMQISEDINCSLASVVFPRNQFNKEYVSVCSELGIETVRTNPKNWYWLADNNNHLKRLFRYIDTFNFFSYNKCVQLEEFISQKEYPYFLPASRFFRSWTNKVKILNKIRLKRILAEMTYAAKHHLYYHIWWHPENFGTFPNENMQDLKVIIQHYKNLQSMYNFTSITMADFGKLIKQQKV